MLKKLAMMAATFLGLTAGYFGYSKGFAILSARVAPIRSVPILPDGSPTSRGLLESHELAVAAFGPTHWAASAAFCYYDRDRGYWIYWNEHVRIGDGKTWTFTPIAVITRSKTSNALKTITGKSARVDFNRPIDLAKPGDEAAHIVHALIQGDVRIRDDKGTADIADDTTSDPMDLMVFDEHDEQITSLSEEQRVVLRDKGLTASGLGMKMELRRRDPNDPAAGFEGIKAISLLRDVIIDVVDVGKSGIVPGGSRAKPEDAPGPDGKARPAGPKPGHIQCDGTMTIQMPRTRKPVRVGPPAPADATLADFDRNVIVRQGDPTDGDRIDCDHLFTILFPREEAAETPNKAEKPAPAKVAAAAPPAGMSGEDEDEEIGEVLADEGMMSNLTLHYAKATGHAVFLKSPSEGTIARGNELKYFRNLPQKPDVIYFLADRVVDVVKTEFFSEGKDKGKPQNVHTIRTVDVTIFQNAPGGPPPSIVARGPGTLETRAAGKEPVDQFASWRDRLTMVSIPETEGREITLVDHPRIWSRTQGEMTADKWIIARMKPKARPPAKPDGSETPSDAAGRVEIIAKDGWVPADGPAARTADGKGPENASSGAGKGMRIETLHGYENVHLVTVATPGDPSAKPPKRGKSADEITARKEFHADFLDPPPGPAATKPVAVAKPAATATATAPAEAVAAADSKPDAEPVKDAPKPAPEPPEPAMVAVADDVKAWVVNSPDAGAKGQKGQVEKAELRGDVVIHQDAEAKQGGSNGGDLTGDFALLKSRGEGRAWIAIEGTPDRPAKAVTVERSILGRYLFVDQAANHAWVRGPGVLVTEQGENDLLQDPKTADPKARKDARTAPKKAKGPLTISWGKDASDKDAWMHFYGQPTDADGDPLPARATFHSHVIAWTDLTDPDRTEDSSLASEDLEATFNRPIAFFKPKPPAPDKTEKKAEEPKAEIAFLKAWNGADLVTRKYEERTHLLEAKRRIIGKTITYERASGQYVVPGAGVVYLYSRSEDDGAPARARQRLGQAQGAGQEGRRGPADPPPEAHPGRVLQGDVGPDVGREGRVVRGLQRRQLLRSRRGDQRRGPRRGFRPRPRPPPRRLLPPDRPDRPGHQRAPSQGLEGREGTDAPEHLGRRSRLLRPDPDQVDLRRPDHLRLAERADVHLRRSQRREPGGHHRRRPALLLGQGLGRDAQPQDQRHQADRPADVPGRRFQQRIPAAADRLHPAGAPALGRLPRPQEDAQGQEAQGPQGPHEPGQADEDPAPQRQGAPRVLRPVESR